MAVFHTPMITLSDGNLIPQIGLGVLRIDDEGVTPVVESALEAGYRHIDGAAGYNNEAGVGRALKNAGFTQGENRKNLWVTTKLRDSEQGYDSARKAFDRQLGLLQLDYVDMYMLHWPTPFDWRSGETWKAFDEFRAEGRVRTLGVCNFLPEHLERLHKETGEYPAVNQIETHVFQQQKTAKEYLKKYGCQIESWGPFAEGRKDMFTNPVLTQIGEKYGKTAAQTALRFLLQSDVVVIPKSTHKDRMQQNFDLFDFTLTAEDMAAIEALDGGESLFFSHYDPKTVEWFMSIL